LAERAVVTASGVGWSAARGGRRGGRGGRGRGMALRRVRGWCGVSLWGARDRAGLAPGGAVWRGVALREAQGGELRVSPR